MRQDFPSCKRCGQTIDPAIEKRWIEDMEPVTMHVGVVDQEWKFMAKPCAVHENCWTIRGKVEHQPMPAPSFGVDYEMLCGDRSHDKKTRPYQYSSESFAGFPSMKHTSHYFPCSIFATGPPGSYRPVTRACPACDQSLKGKMEREKESAVDRARRMKVQ